MSMNLTAGDEKEKEKEKDEREMRPLYSTQAAAAADGRDLEAGNMKRGQDPVTLQDLGPDTKTVSLSQVDANTLANFEVSIHMIA